MRGNKFGNLSLVVPSPVIPPRAIADEKRNLAIYGARARKFRAIDCLAAHSFRAARANISAAEHFAKIAQTRTNNPKNNIKIKNMCDFHSVVVRLDGAKAHLMTNSHSGAVEAAKWRENDHMAQFRGAFFVECEWNCLGTYPGARHIARDELNDKQVAAIDTHYQALAQLLANPAAHAQAALFGNGIFAGEEYGDVRWKVMIHPECPSELIPLLAVTSLFADGSKIKSLHPSITKIAGNFSVAERYKIDAPALVEVCGDVVVEQGASLTAPALVEVSGLLRVEQGASLTAPALVEVSGDVVVAQGASLTAPALVEVSGHVVVEQGASLTAPALEKAGYVRVDQGASLTAPALVEVRRLERF